MDKPQQSEVSKRKWFKWAALEGITKTASAVVQKLVGTSMSSPEMSLFGATVIGSVQIVSGYTGYRLGWDKDRKRLFPGARAIVWPILFGASGSLIGTALPFYLFSIGAEIGITTLLISSSVIWGAFIGRIIWGDLLGMRQVLGLLIFFVAMWTIFDFPSLGSLGSLPLWGYLALFVGLGNACNEAFARKAIGQFSIWTNNFWVGLSSVFFTVLPLAAFLIFSDSASFRLNGLYLFGVIVIGFIVVAMISYKLLSYIGGGTIALKKLITQGTYMILTVYAGVIVWGEPLTTGKIIGPYVAIAALALFDKDALPFIRSFIFQNKESRTQHGS